MKKDILFLSMKEDKSKLLAKVMSNETCRKIMDHLASKNGTETEIAKDLSLPLSTVHYNIDQMVKAGLITIEEYHYSEKGKEVNHYKLANKYIFIYPGEDTNEGFNLKERFASFFPVLLAIVFVGFLLNMNLFGFNLTSKEFASPTLMTQDIAAPVGGEGDVSAQKVATVNPMEDSSVATTSVSALEVTGVGNNTSISDENVAAVAYSSVPSENESSSWYDNISSSSKWFVIGGVLSMLALLLLQYFYYLAKKK